jgi:hypothetical protein
MRRSCMHHAPPLAPLRLVSVRVIIANDICCNKMRDYLSDHLHNYRMVYDSAKSSNLVTSGCFEDHGACNNYCFRLQSCCTLLWCIMHNCTTFLIHSLISPGFYHIDGVYMRRTETETWFDALQVDSRAWDRVERTAAPLT